MQHLECLTPMESSWQMVCIFIDVRFFFPSYMIIIATDDDLLGGALEGDGTLN